MRAFITGVTGQDGHYLAELLLSKGYQVYGLVRRTSQRKCIPNGIEVVEGDITDPSIIPLIESVAPDEIYHLAAMSHVGESFRIPQTTFEVNALGALNVLQAARSIRCKLYQASTSELFGDSPPPQNEQTPFRPRSPYAISKLAAYWLAVNYREMYGLYVVNGILFNHESPRRGEDFVTQKIAQYCARLKSIGPHQRLKLGNLLSKRDWGHAKDFVYGMWLMMQQPEPSDYVLATGVARSVNDLAQTAFAHIGISSFVSHIETEPALFRPLEVTHLCGDASKARRIGWEPKISFNQMIGEMIDAAFNDSSR